MFPKLENIGVECEKCAYVKMTPCYWSIFKYYHKKCPVCGTVLISMTDILKWFIIMGLVFILYPVTYLISKLFDSNSDLDINEYHVSTGKGKPLIEKAKE